ncbi:hypothetical protein AOQ84DRAFT_296865 [Glonium stellatum]|uniref:Uncharacterized protein n=1 Tax=Glonium stellatum TaxID=574774 RepID=A0A8E2EX32_9PEZI|nr:hypothetical protein AOQ84DRAFT_296865 [Glonium stellatum]
MKLSILALLFSASVALTSPATVSLNRATRSTELNGRTLLTPCIECPCQGLEGPCTCVANGCCCT